MNLWTRPERASRGPAPEHSRASLAVAAIAIADADGLGKVSMRRVAAELGTGAASLYRYVDTRDELLDLMADTVIGELEPGPRTGDAVADLCELARHTLALHRRHPWMLDLTPGSTSMGPHAVDVVEWALAAMSGVDVPGEVKMETFALLSGFTSLFARSEVINRAADASMAEWEAAFMAQTMSQGRHPHLAAVIGEGPIHSGGDTFERVLPQVLAALLGLPPAP